MELSQSCVKKLQWMSSGKSVKFSALVASMSITRKPCNLFLNQRAMFCESSAGVGKSVVFQAWPIVYSCVDPLTCEKNIVLIVSPLINLVKDQVSA